MFPWSGYRSSPISGYDDGVDDREIAPGQEGSAVRQPNMFSSAASAPTSSYDVPSGTERPA